MAEDIREERDYWRSVALGPQPLDVNEVVTRLINAHDDGRTFDGISAADFVCAYNRLASEQLHDLKQRARRAEAERDAYRDYVAYLLSVGVVDAESLSLEGVDEAVRRTVEGEA